MGAPGYLSVADVAAIGGVKPETIHVYRARYAGTERAFPAPDPHTGGRLVWSIHRAAEIKAWFNDARRRQQAGRPPRKGKSDVRATDTSDQA